MESSTPAGVLPFRQPTRIDYSDTRVMKRRRLQKLQQRAHVLAGCFVVGRWFSIDGKLVLAAVRMNATYDIDTNGLLTTCPHTMHRWNTKQGARQWLKRHPRPGCHLVNIDRLGAHPDWSPDGQVRHD